jgi:Flp pilus assembly pilin Flp
MITAPEVSETPEGTLDLHDDAGQATVEYALVLLGAALIALLLIGWATVGGGAARIGQFLGHVFDVIEKKVV